MQQNKYVKVFLPSLISSLALLHRREATMLTSLLHLGLNWASPRVPLQASQILSDDVKPVGERGVSGMSPVSLVGPG